MATILQKIKQLQALDEMQVAADSVRDTKETFADTNVEQMMAGLRNDGSEILPSYKDITIEIKKLKNQPVDRVTLRDSGAFQNALTTDVSGLNIITTSSDPKTAKLRKKYETARGGLFGLGGKFKQKYIDEDLNPAFLKNMRKATGLK